MLKSWKNAQNPHFSSGAETPIFTPELKCAPSAKIECGRCARSKGAETPIFTPLLRAGFCKNRIFVQSRLLKANLVGLRIPMLKNLHIWKSRKQRRIIVVCFAAVFVINASGCQRHISSNKPDKSGLADSNGTPEGYAGLLHGAVETEAPPVFNKSDDLEDTLNNSSLGKVRLVFPGSGTNREIRVEVPAEALQLLNAAYKHKLRSCLTSTPIDSSVQERVNKDKKLMLNLNTIKNQLLNIQIEAPDGKRKVSGLESDRLFAYAIKTAVNMVGSCDN
jgi:hypothetical protein